MITPPSFPAVRGIGWSVHKTPVTSTRVANHVSGREVRTKLYANALYQFELTIESLDSSGQYAGLGPHSLQELMGLYLQVGGQFGTFLFTDPSDTRAVGQAIAISDGTTSNFPFMRTIGGFVEPIGWVTYISAIYLDGIVLDSTAYALVLPNTLNFPVAAPPNASVITADFNFAFVCRFLDDQQDFEQIMSGLWAMGSLKFRTVRTS